MESGARYERGGGYIESGWVSHSVLAGIRAGECETGRRWVGMRWMAVRGETGIARNWQGR